MKYPFVEIKCAECGKVFIPAALHSYKIDGKMFCRYTCKKHYQERQQSKSQKATKKTKIELNFSL